MADADHRWWELTFTGDDIEERALELHELGSSGGHLISSTEIKVYLDEQILPIDDFLSRSKASGFVLAEKKLVVQENWNSLCPELWEPLTVGRVTITPVMSVDSGTRSCSEGELLIIPGTGFGTGHHATTATLTRWLQETELFSSPPVSILDLGTGSGILAILASKLFHSEVVAVDIDDLALSNARDNFQLNGVKDKISIIEGTADDVQGNFDLIIANIYAEILSDIEKRVAELLKPGGILFLSGIHEDKLAGIQQCYSSANWKWLRCETHDTWASAILTNTQDTI